MAHILTNMLKPGTQARAGSCQSRVPHAASAPWGQDAHACGRRLRLCDSPWLAWLAFTAASPALSWFGLAAVTTLCCWTPRGSGSELLSRSFLPMLAWRVVPELCPEASEQSGNALRLGIPINHPRQPLLLAKKPEERHPNTDFSVGPH